MKKGFLSLAMLVAAASLAAAADTGPALGELKTLGVIPEAATKALQAPAPQREPAGKNKEAGVDEPAQSIERVFENSRASGQVLAMHIGGAQKVVPAVSCIADWQSYLFGNDPARAGHYLQLTVNNKFGMAFVNVHLPWKLVPPFSPMPTDLLLEPEDSFISRKGDIVTTIKDGLLKHVEKKHYSDDSSSWDETETVTLRFNQDFTKVWDMTFNTTASNQSGPDAPKFNETAYCGGEFRMTKNIVENKN